ncbi:MAG: tetratricopeptide repeat protein [Deltaproteobacteria bacterium]|nr:tetratricopeptide repeat protein [Deltaproteobacteria bacterium]
MTEDARLGEDGEIVDLGSPKRVPEEIRADEQKVIIEDLPEKPYTREFKAVATPIVDVKQARPEESEAAEAPAINKAGVFDNEPPSQESWVVLERKSTPPPAAEQEANPSGDMNASPASEIVEDMLTLMRPRPAPAETDRPESAEDAGSEPISLEKKPEPMAEDGFFAAGDNDDIDAGDEDFEMPKSSSTWIWVLAILVAIGLGAGGYWYHVQSKLIGNVPKVDEPRVDEPKVDEPKVDEPKVDEPKVDEPKVDEPKVDEPKVDEPPPLPKDSADFEKALREGKVALEAGAFGKAIKNLNQALKIKPGCDAAMVALANAEFERGKSDLALKWAWKALEIDPSNARAYLTLGTIYQNLDKNPEAIKYYRKFLSLQPAGPMAHEVRFILKRLK